MPSRIPNHLLRQMGVAILCAFCLSPAHASTTLAEWAITATTGATNTSAPVNYFPVFAATEIISGHNLYTANTGLTPTGTWYRLYTNSPNPIPSHGGLQAISIGDYFTFNTVISAGAVLNVDGISNLILGKSSSAATNAGLYYSTDNGSVWVQAGGTAYIPAFTGTNDYSSSINVGFATNQYQTNGGIFNTGPYTTNSGLAVSPILFDNSASTNALTVEWALAFSGGGNGRLGIGNGGNLLALNGNIISVPEASTNALFCLGVLVLVIAFALIRASAARFGKPKS